MTTHEELLRDALRPNRPDPSAFKRAVEEKLAKREAEREAKIGDGGWLSQAAGILPLGLLEPTLLSGTAVAAGKKLGLKSAGAMMALPALSLAMLGVAFFGGLRATMRLNPSGGTQDDAARASAEWWRVHRIHAIVTLVILGVLAVTQPAEALLAVLLVSMLTVASLLATLSRSGAATRARVGNFTTSFLGILLVLIACFPGFAAGVRTVHVSSYWIPLVLIAGHFACHFAGTWSCHWSARRKRWTAIAPPAVMGLVVAGIVTGAQPPSEAQMVAFVETFDVAFKNSSKWQSFGTVCEWLASRNVAFDAAPARRRVEEAWRASANENHLIKDDLSPYSLWAAVHADAISDELWSAIADEAEGRMRYRMEFPITAPRQEYGRLVALIRRGALTDEQRDAIAERALAAWPATRNSPHRPALEVGVLEKMDRLADLLELIDRPISSDEHRVEAHAALTHFWLGRLEERPYPGPFVEAEHQLEPSSASLFGGRPSDFSFVGPTHNAVNLMLRFGIPEAIDLDRVHAFLEHAATPSLIEVVSPDAVERLTTQPYRYAAAVALLKIEGAPLVRPSSLDSPRSLATLVVTERALLGAILLVALCLFATLRASESADVEDAEPAATVKARGSRESRC